jgi:hypothetical protein
MFFNVKDKKVGQDVFTTMVCINSKETHG